MASTKIKLNQLIQDGASSNDVLKWNGSAWAPSTTSDNNGIYTASGNIATSCVATLANASTFTIAYYGGNAAVLINDATSTSTFSSKDYSHQLVLSNSYARLAGSSHTLTVSSDTTTTDTAVITNTNTAATRFIIGSNSSNAIANGFGSILMFRGETSTTDDQDMAYIKATWADSTHASRTGRLALGASLSGTNTDLVTIYSNALPYLSFGSGTTYYSNGSITPGTSYTIGGNSNNITIGSTLTSAITILSGNSAATGIYLYNSNASGGITIDATTAARTSSNPILKIGNTTFTSTTTDVVVTKIGGNWNPTSAGTSSYIGLSLEHTINQTTHTGNSYGLYINPTLTAVNAGYQSYTGIYLSISNANAVQFCAAGTSPSAFGGSVIIGDINAPTSSAVLDVVSTTKGILIPRMTTTERNAISSPVDGLILYNSTTGKFTVRQSGAWTEMGSGGGGGGSVATDVIWDAKGDLAVGTGADTAAKLSVGTNGQILAADSTQSTGLIWITPSASTIYAYTSKTTTYSIGANDHIVNCTSGTFTTTLPTAVGVTGKVYNIKNSGTGVITVDTTSSQTIDGSTTYSLGQYDSIQLCSDGSNWIIL